MSTTTLLSFGTQTGYCNFPRHELLTENPLKVDHMSLTFCLIILYMVSGECSRFLFNGLVGMCAIYRCGPCSRKGAIYIGFCTCCYIFALIRHCYVSIPRSNIE